MVYHLTFEDMNQLLKHQIMSPSELSHATSTTAPFDQYLMPTNHLNSKPSSHGFSENNILMQCMQKLGQYAPPTVDARVVLQESNGQMMSTSSAKLAEAGGSALDEPLGGGGGSGPGGCTPRPRWCPTPEQIQVLEALFNSGTTTPSRDMIVEIAGCLKQFGNIVEANVFYWFQNRKARAKRKLRMQAQLQQQAAATTATSPSNSNDFPSAAAAPQHGKSSATSRRVCAKTACKTSPSTADHYLPPLVHLPTSSVHHFDHHLDHYHSVSLAAAPAACGNLQIMPPQPSLQVMNNATSCKMMSSSNDERPSCAFSNTCSSAANVLQSHEQHAHNQVLSQPLITTPAPRQPPFADHQLDCGDHHCNPIQHHIECNPYISHMSCLNTADVHLPSMASTAGSSPPGSAGSSDTMVGSSWSPKSVAIAHETAAANIPHIFQTPTSTNFLASSADQNHYSSPAADDTYSTLHAQLTHISSNIQYQDRIGSLSLPSKRSWMDAMMQEYVSKPTHTKTNTATASNEWDLQTKAGMLHINHDHNHTPNIDLNLLLERPHIHYPSQAALVNSRTLFSTDLSRRADSGVIPLSQSNFVIQGDNNGTSTTALCSNRHLQTSSPSEAFHHELHGQENKRITDQATVGSLMCSTSITSQQQQSSAFATSSPPNVIHHCDNLPLWEALAPYMSIGS